MDVCLVIVPQATLCYYPVGHTDVCFLLAYLQLFLKHFCEFDCLGSPKYLRTNLSHGTRLCNTTGLGRNHKVFKRKGRLLQPVNSP